MQTHIVKIIKEIRNLKNKLQLLFWCTKKVIVTQSVLLDHSPHPRRLPNIHIIYLEHIKCNCYNLLRAVTITLLLLVVFNSTLFDFNQSQNWCQMMMYSKDVSLRWNFLHDKNVICNWFLIVTKPPKYYHW